MTQVQTRQHMERNIARRLVTDAIAAGYTVDVNDGEAITVRSSSSVQKVIAAMMTTDEDYLILRRFDANGAQIVRGWVRLVYGNSGYDVICDYTVNLEPLMAGAETLAAKLEETK